MSGYVGRFAPSPTGPLHAGSTAAALAGYLDAKAHGGRWLLRVEDVDTPRTVAGAAERIQDQLHYLGLDWEGPVVFQSARVDRYHEAFERLAAAGRLFGCACSRREIADSMTVLQAGVTPANSPPIYPGTCRNGIPGNRAARAWRFRVDETAIQFQDRWLGPQRQHPASETGDFVVRRADGLWAYQLAVVVDDADAGVTHVVRGRDILESTGRQILLQRALGYQTPSYLHLPLAVGADGEKLSKQNGARSVTAVDASGSPPAACDLLDQAARLLQMQPPATRDRSRWLAEATRQWTVRFRS